jgi:CRP/FNR family transcriptional regulator
MVRVGRASLEDIRRIPYFESVPDDGATRVAQQLTVHSYAARDLIVVEGEPCRGFSLVRAGRGRVFRTSTDGREQTLRLIAPGDTFGEVPVFDGGPNPASVEAIERSEIVLIPKQTLLALSAQYPAVSTAVLGHFARRLRSFTELVEQLSLQTVQNRIARYLYLLAREEGTVTAEGTVVPRVITQQDLASLVGSVREVVSRTLRVMEEDEVVEIRRQEIVIRDLGALARLV